MMHTPGPWNIVESVNYLDGFSRVCGSKGPIAKIISSVAGDAELIAAAPEMLEALEKARRVLQLEFPASVYLANFAFIDEAIEKARGT